MPHFDPPIYKQCINNGATWNRLNVVTWENGCHLKTQICSPTCNDPFHICIIHGSLRAFSVLEIEGQAAEDPHTIKFKHEV